MDDIVEFALSKLGITVTPGLALLILIVATLAIVARPIVWLLNKGKPWVRILLRQKNIKVEAIDCKPLAYERTNYTAWAELRITNLGPEPLEDVNVLVHDCVGVYKRGQEPELGKHFLARTQPWNPSSIYWSEKNAEQKQLSITIPSQSTRAAVVAFHTEPGIGLAVLNSPNSFPLLESKLDIEISSPGIKTTRESFYLAYYPPRTDAFEFVEWDTWRKAHEWIKRQPEKEIAPKV